MQYFFRISVLQTGQQRATKIAESFSWNSGVPNARWMLLLIYSATRRATTLNMNMKAEETSFPFPPNTD